MVEKERIRELTSRMTSRTEDPGNAASGAAGYVLYWMQASQRAEYNHALEFAAEKANELELPLLVCFGITYGYPEANLRHYTFMLEGLVETSAALRKRGIPFVVRETGGEADEESRPWQVAADLGKQAALIVTDRGYLRHQRQWREELARMTEVPVIEVETDVVVPVETASNKREYAARTIRPKLNKLLDRVRSLPGHVKLEHTLTEVPRDVPGGIDLSAADIGSFFTGKVDETVGPVTEYIRGGTEEAKKRLVQFIEYKLPYYDTQRNNPGLEIQSGLSPYLHFGQISPLYIIEEVQRAVEASGSEETEEAAEAFIEELFIRRELSINYVYFEPDYDQYTALPGWAGKSLSEHAGDHRPDLYSRTELEEASTHDEYWNAAMEEMVRTGTMHNYMRMYWGKKVLEWSRSPEEAFETLLYLNNKYFLDGRDPNSYAGVAWCFGNHDRPWQEREIFGKVRYMNKAGLDRKFDMDEYLRRVGKLW
jgi:deoxyribodipyrimidine photo-lyase